MIHWKASPGESGVPMILYRHNDLGMRLQKLTTSFGLLRSELMNYSQMGVVNFPLRLFRDNGDTIGAITIVWKWWNTLFVGKEQGPHLHIKRAWSVCKLIPTMRSQAILLFCFHEEIDGQTLLICCILVLTQIRNPTTWCTRGLHDWQSDWQACVKLHVLSFSFLAYLHFPMWRFSMGAIQKCTKHFNLMEFHIPRVKSVPHTTANPSVIRTSWPKTYTIHSITFLSTISLITLHICEDMQCNATKAQTMQIKKSKEHIF